MRIFIWITLILTAVSAINGCARAQRIANDINWVVFDGEPAEDN